MISTKKETYTYADYAKLPEGSPYQLIDGMLVKSPSPLPLHQRIAKRIFKKLLMMETEGIGEAFFAPVDVYLSEQETYQPDLLFITAERFQIVGEKKIEGAPDVIIEILSSSTAYYDLRHKKEMYASSGVKEYWIIDPPDRIIELHLNSNEELILKARKKEKGSITSSLFAGFTLCCMEVFGL